MMIAVALPPSDIPELFPPFGRVVTDQVSWAADSEMRLCAEGSMASGPGNHPVGAQG